MIKYISLYIYFSLFSIAVFFILKMLWIHFSQKKNT